jgi:hypothetical protein
MYQLTYIIAALRAKQNQSKPQPQPKPVTYRVPPTNKIK